MKSYLPLVTSSPPTIAFVSLCETLTPIPVIFCPDEKTLYDENVKTENSERNFMVQISCGAIAIVMRERDKQGFLGIMI